MNESRFHITLNPHYEFGSCEWPIARAGSIPLACFRALKVRNIKRADPVYIYDRSNGNRWNLKRPMTADELCEYMVACEPEPEPEPPQTRMLKAIVAAEERKNEVREANGQPFMF